MFGAPIIQYMLQSQKIKINAYKRLQSLSLCPIDRLRAQILPQPKFCIASRPEDKIIKEMTEKLRLFVFVFEFLV